MPDTVIEIDEVWKKYRLGVLSTGTLFHDLNRWWYRIRGKPDPCRRVEEYTSPRGPRLTALDSAAPAPLADDEIWALRGVSLAIGRGEVLGIIGRNGSGKSTLLKILSRVTAPSHGEVRVRGRVASLLEIGTGFHPELTGRQNIFLNGAILGMSKGEIRGKLDEIIDFAEVDKYIDTPVKRYSSGMYVRLAFAVAAHLDPEILVVDEVLAVGDAAFQAKCLGKMGDVGRAGRTVLFVSHNMAAVQKLCTQTVWMQGGSVAAHGSTRQLVDGYLNSAHEQTRSRDDRPPGFIHFREASAVQGDYAIVGVELIDRDGKPMAELGTWDYVRLRLHYLAKRRIKRGAIEFTVQSPDEIPLIRCSTQPDSAVPCSIEPGLHYADCIFPQWPLAAGEYILGGGVGRPGARFPYWENNLCRIQVARRDVLGSGFSPVSDRGLVAVPHTWEIAGTD